MSIIIILLIIAGGLILLFSAFFWIMVGLGLNYRPGSIPLYDALTGQVEWINPRSIKPAPSAAKIIVKKNHGPYGILSKEVAIDTPFVQSNRTGKPIFAVTPYDAYVKAVLGIVKLTWLQFEKSKLEAGEYRMRFEEQKYINEFEIDDRTTREVKRYFDHVPTMMPRKPRQQGSGGGGSYGPRTY